MDFSAIIVSELIWDFTYFVLKLNRLVEQRFFIFIFSLHRMEWMEFWRGIFYSYWCVSV